LGISDGLTSVGSTPARPVIGRMKSANGKEVNADPISRQAQCKKKVIRIY
jgi:hypothetical protein